MTIDWRITMEDHPSIPPHDDSLRVPCLIWIDASERPEIWELNGQGGYPHLCEWDPKTKSWYVGGDIGFIPAERGPYWIALHEIRRPE